MKKEEAILHLCSFAAVVIALGQPPLFAQDQEPRRIPGGADPSDDAFEMGSPPALPEGLTEEQMWPAATAEQWKSPCLVPWQRTFDDALCVARAKRRPILVCVNMDGEIASEHFAGVRYRDPASVAELAGYVCVIASVYRHTPRDYDEQGRRVECPRFGTVTCGEHVQAERELYELYFDGRRIAPRHIVLDLDGTETWDVYYSWDTATVFTTFRKGLEGWPPPVDSVEPTLEYLTRSADVEDREALERAYEEGDAPTQRAILVALLREEAVDQVEVLRRAIFGLDLEHARLAREALARCTTDGSLDLMAAVLDGPLPAGEREHLLAAVDRIGETSARARTLAAVHSGLSLSSHHIDAAQFAREYEANASGSRLDVDARERAASDRPEDPAALLELAQGQLERALDPAMGRFAELLIEDARRTASRAESLGARDPRLDAVLAVTAAEGGDRRAARERAVAAVEGGLLLADVATDRRADLAPALKARVLRLFSEQRRLAIRAAYRAKEDWPPAWLSDVNAAHEVLAQGALAEADLETLLVDHHDFLRWVGATPRADAVLEDALQRFPESARLHERLRSRLLWRSGPAGLEAEYAERLAREKRAGTAPTQLTWFAGYASLVAAEHHRRRGEFDAALAAYERGIEHYEHNIEEFPAERDGGVHFITMAHAGRARVELERGALEEARGSLLRALELRPGSAGTMDGLGITPIATAKMLMARCLDAGRERDAQRVQAALDALDPALLEPSPAERRGSRWRRGGR